MKKLAILLCVVILGGCVTPMPIPPETKAAVDRIPVEDLPIYASTEQQRCPKSRYMSFDKRRECKYEVRREIAARKMMREQSETIEKETTKEQSNATIKN
jgi:hypothetical protein